MERNHNLLAILDAVEGASFAGIDTLTPVVLKGGKKNPYQGRITKRVTGSNVMLFSNKNGSAYENMVRRRLAQEGKDPNSFVLSPRSWGERMKEYPIVYHSEKNRHYLEAIFLKPGVIDYFLDGKPVTKTKLNNKFVRDKLPTLPESNEAEQGGLEDKVVIRTYAIENIIALRCDGKQYIGSFHVNL